MSWKRAVRLKMNERRHRLPTDLGYHLRYIRTPPCITLFPQQNSLHTITHETNAMSVIHLVNTAAAAAADSFTPGSHRSVTGQAHRSPHAKGR